MFKIFGFIAVFVSLYSGAFFYVSFKDFSYDKKSHTAKHEVNKARSVVL